MGPPGCGKGTQSKKIKEYNPDFIRIDMGNLLRSSNSLDIKEKVTQGLLLSNEEIETVLDNYLQNRKSNIIFDGIPRAYEQCLLLQKKSLIPDILFLFFISEEESYQRIANRYLHLSSGRIYNTITNPPKIAMQDDITGEILQKRSDDQEETLKHRLKLYQDNQENILRWFYDLNVPVIYIDGKGNINIIHQYIKNIISYYSIVMNKNDEY
jgi:adenylate kinase